MPDGVSCRKNIVEEVVCEHDSGRSEGTRTNVGKQGMAYEMKWSLAFIKEMM